MVCHSGEPPDFKRAESWATSKTFILVANNSMQVMAFHSNSRLDISEESCLGLVPAEALQGALID